MSTIQKAVYFEICVQIWDTAQPCPPTLLPVMFPDVPNWKEILEQLEAMGKLYKNKKGNWIQDRAMDEAEWSYDTWKRKSDGGKKGKKHRKKRTPEPDPKIVELRKQDDGASNFELALPEASENDLFKQAVGLWNEMAQRCGVPKVQQMDNPKRKRGVAKCLKMNGGIEGWKEAMAKIEASPGLQGKGADSWSGVKFDWLFEGTNFAKIMEGNYDNWKGKIEKAKI